MILCGVACVFVKQFYFSGSVMHRRSHLYVLQSKLPCSHDSTLEAEARAIPDSSLNNTIRTQALLLAVILAWAIGHHLSSRGR